MQRLPDIRLPTVDRHCGWRVIDGCLSVDGVPLGELLQQRGSPCYVYSRQRIDARIAEIRAALPRATELLYPLKANPLPALLEHMVGRVDGFDIASGGPQMLKETILHFGFDEATLTQHDGVSTQAPRASDEEAAVGGDPHRGPRR